jgi:hypothetical protein
MFDKLHSFSYGVVCFWQNRVKRNNETAGVRSPKGVSFSVNPISWKISSIISHIPLVKSCHLLSCDVRGCNQNSRVVFGSNLEIIMDVFIYINGAAHPLGCGQIVISFFSRVLFH